MRAPPALLLVDPGALHAALGALPDPGDTAFVLNSAVVGEVGGGELSDPTGLLRVLFPGMSDDQKRQTVKFLGAEAAAALFGAASAPYIGPYLDPEAYKKVTVKVPWWVWVALIYLLRKHL